VKLFFLPVLLSAALFAAEKPYDPKADPAADLKAAVAQATKEKRNIFLDVGGEWCSWCHRMDKLFADNAALLELREKHYVFLKVNYSEENKNVPFLSQYPKVEGYPHIFILDSSGKLLHSQNTGDLEEGKGYNLQRYTEFLSKWAPR
jgi:thioredoxin-related protein